MLQMVLKQIQILVFFEGERFSERRNFYHKPIDNINWDFKINDAIELSTVVYGSWGRGGGTGGFGRGRVRYDDAESSGNGLSHEIDFDAIQTQNVATVPNGIASSELQDDALIDILIACRLHRRWRRCISNMDCFEF